MRGGGRRGTPTISRCGWRNAAPTRRWSPQLRAIDFYFLNLSQLRQALIEAFQQLRRGSPALAEERPMRLLDRYEEIVGHREVNGSAGWPSGWRASGSCTSTPRGSAAAWPRSWAGWFR